MDRARRRAIALALALAAQLVAPCARRRGLPGAAGPHHRRLHPGVVGRHHRARAGPAHGPDSRPAIRGREQAGRRLQPGGRIRRARAEGRLHAVPRIVRQHHQCGHQSQSFLRHGQGLCADRARHHGRRHPRGAPFDRREQRAGADRARQIEAGRSVLRLDRGRHGPASLRRTVRHAQPASSSCTCPTRAARKR